MNIQDSEIKDQFILRLRRIEGQVRGIETMVENDRDCREILQQLSAAHAALQAFSRNFMQEYAIQCMANFETSSTSDSPETKGLRREKLVQEMISLLGKSP